MEYEFNDCVDLLFDFTKDELDDEGTIRGIILDEVTARLQDIIRRCQEIIIEDEEE